MKTSGKPKKVPARLSTSPVKKTRAVSPQVVRSREALRRGLLSLLADRSLEQVTNQDITGAAGVGYATFFRHYNSKEDLLTDLAESKLAAVVAAATRLVDSHDTYIACLALCQSIEAERDAWTTLLAKARTQLRDAGIRLTALNRPEKNRDQTWIPVELGIQIGVSSTLEILSWWMAHPEQLSAETAAEALNRMVVAPAFA